MYHFNRWLHCNKYLILFYTVDLYAFVLWAYASNIRSFIQWTIQIGQFSQKNQFCGCTHFRSQNNRFCSSAQNFRKMPENCGSLVITSLLLYSSPYDLYCVGGMLSLTQSINQCIRCRWRLLDRTTSKTLKYLMHACQVVSGFSEWVCSQLLHCFTS